MKTALSDLLCRKYYKYVESPADGKTLIPGQLVSAHSVYPPAVPWIIKVQNYNAFDESKSQYIVKKFEKNDRSHMPIAELRLRTDENYYVQVGKERPGIVIAEVSSSWSNMLKAEEFVLCAPIYSFKNRHSDEFRIKTMGFCYRNLFYLPSDSEGCTEDSACRFEHIQPVAKKALHSFVKGMPPRRVALSDEAFLLLVNHLSRFLHTRDLDVQVCEQIDIYRSLVEEQLNTQKS